MSDYQCIFVVTERGKGDDVVAKAKASGAYGGTIVSGRGSSIHEKRKIFNMMIKPEKDIIIIVVKKDIVAKIKAVIRESFDLDKVGKGILFVIDVEDVVGVDIPLKEE